MTALVGPRLLAWIVGLGLALLLVTLLIAAEESIRPTEVAPPVTQAVEPERPLDRRPVDDTYGHPGLTAWPTP